MKRGWIQGDGPRLAYVDFGGEGQSLLLLHGLFGRATTWHETARWLTPHFRVVGLDQRGHGLSDKPAQGYSMEQYVADAERAITKLGLGPTVIIGHSMGALIAWLLAARRPDLVRGLVLVDMTPATTQPGDGARVTNWLDTWLDTWPVPFASMADVRTYFASLRPGLADYFVEVMTEADDGYRPLFQTEHMRQSATAIDEKDWWSELAQVQCPTLVVRGSESEFRRDELQRMAQAIPGAAYTEVDGAHHTVAHDQPERWRAAVEPFLLHLT